MSDAKNPRPIKYDPGATPMERYLAEMVAPDAPYEDGVARRLASGYRFGLMGSVDNPPAVICTCPCTCGARRTDGPKGV